MISDLSPRGHFGLGEATLTSASAWASNIWPRPGLLVVLLCNRAVFGNFVNFSGNNLKSYVVNHYLVLFRNYFWPQPWPQPPEIGLGLGLEVSASSLVMIGRAVVSVQFLASGCRGQRGHSAARPAALLEHALVVALVT